MILGEEPFISEMVLSQLIPDQDWGKIHTKAFKNHNNGFGEKRLAHIRTLVVYLILLLMSLFCCLWHL
jgi:hypothetical protein